MFDMSNVPACLMPGEVMKIAVLAFIYYLDFSANSFHCCFVNTEGKDAISLWTTLIFIEGWEKKIIFHEFLGKGCEVESDKLDENRLDKKCDKIMQLTPVQIVTERQKSDIW